jgi:Cu/Ag efflux pump CusA
LEYHAEVQGDYAVRQASLQRVLIASLIAVVGIFVLLQASFASWCLASAAILTFPMALMGGVLAASLRGGFSLSSLFASLAVLGIAARNGVVMTSRFHRLERDGSEALGPQLVMRGARERLVP